jgi:hypothetical protein
MPRPPIVQKQPIQPEQTIEDKEWFTTFVTNMRKYNYQPVDPTLIHCTEFTKEQRKFYNAKFPKHPLQPGFWFYADPNFFRQ